jgi:hypothetical protein
MNEFQLAGTVTVDASQTDGELKKLSDKLQELKELQKQFIDAFGEGAPEVAALSQAISELETQIGTSAGAAQTLAENLASVEAPEIKIQIDEVEVPEIQIPEIDPVEIPVTVGEIPPIAADEVPAIEIPVTVAEVPEIETPKVDPVNIETNAAEVGAQLQQTSDVASELSGKLSEVNQPLEAIQKSIAAAQIEMAKAVREFGKGSPEADKLAKKIALLQSALAKLGTPVKAFSAAMGDSVEEIENVADSFDAIPAAANDATQAVEGLADAQTDLLKSAKEAEQSQEQLGKATDKTGAKVEDLNKKLDDNAKASDGSKKSTGGLMTLLKGAGIIGAAAAAFDLLKNALGKNQKVADTVAAVMKTIENVLGAVVEVVVNVIDKVSESTNGFDALTKVLKGAITIAFTPLKLAFGGISLFIKEAQLAWEQSFFGDKDPETIKQLTASIAETKEGLKETAESALQAGKDIVNNFGEAVSQAGQVISGVVAGVSEINVAAIYESSKATVQLQNNAKLAAAALAGVVEQYGAQAEKLRQIRDDDRKSIDERIAANNELGEVLKKQQDAQLALVDSKIAAAQADLNANKGSIELQEALINAQNERKAVLNQIAGFQSEQLANEKALAAEALALAKATGQAESENYLTRKKNNAELITDELAKNQALQAIRNEERALEIQRLTDQVNLFAEGTQARLDAEIELQNKKNELDQADAVAAQDRENIKRQRSNETKDAIIANAIAENNLKKQLLDNEGSNLREKSQRKLQILRDESALVIQQLELQRTKEIQEAELAGKSTAEIKAKYATAISAVNVQLLQSEKELALAVLEENQKRAQEIFKTIEQAVGFYQELIDGQLQKVEQRQSKEAEVQKQLLDDKKITQEQYEKNINAVNQKAEKEKIKLQKRQIIAEKATGIANIIMSTLQANAKSIATFPITAGQPWVTINTIQGAIGVATTIAQAAKALSALGAGGGGESGGGAASIPTGTAAPVAPVMGSTTLNPTQFGDMVQTRATPVRAYVVESDVRDGQERMDRISRAATIG